MFSSQNCGCWGILARGIHSKTGPGWHLFWMGKWGIKVEIHLWHFFFGCDYNSPTPILCFMFSDVLPPRVLEIRGHICSVFCVSVRINMSLSHVLKTERSILFSVRVDNRSLFPNISQLWFPFLKCMLEIKSIKDKYAVNRDLWSPVLTLHHKTWRWKVEYLIDLVLMYVYLSNSFCHFPLLRLLTMCVSNTACLFSQGRSFMRIVMWLATGNHMTINETWV